MDTIDDADVDGDIMEAQELGQQLIDAILEGAPSEDIHALVDAHAPLWYQAPDGTSALHAAAYAGDAALIKLLIDKGAIWNAMDDLQNTAGDIALSLNDGAAYELIRDAGLRTELLLALLAQKSAGLDTLAGIVLKSVDASASGDTDVFLASRLTFATDAHGQEVCMVRAGGEDVGVMMGWERDIMQHTVDRLCNDHPGLTKGLRILNIGFGLGIIDSMFQALPTPPAEHVIVEAHPDVLAHMEAAGWMDKPGVTVLRGKWQDVLEDPLLAAGEFDVVYTDTFSEDYAALKQFFEHVPELLAGPAARFSFFHGLGATNALFYDVYSKLSELHLAELGMDVAWADVRVADEDADGGRWGASRKYFTLPWYRLPVVSMGGDTK